MPKRELINELNVESIKINFRMNMEETNLNCNSFAENNPMKTGNTELEFVE